MATGVLAVLCVFVLSVGFTRLGAVPEGRTVHTTTRNRYLYEETLRVVAPESVPFDTSQRAWIRSVMFGVNVLELKMTC